MSRQVLVSLMFLLGACSSDSKPVTRQPIAVSLETHYAAAIALPAVLAQNSVSDDDIDRLLSLRGVAAMVDNTTKYLPADTRDTFRAAVKEFVTTRRSTIGHFGLDDSFQKSAETRLLITKLQADTNLVAEVAGRISKYMPSLPHFTATVYGVAGGVSDGFVMDNEIEPVFYMNLNRAEGDAQGVKLNMTHELYHVVQRMARRQVPGLDAKVFDPATAPADVRLLTVIFEEGTATYVAEPLLGEDSFFRKSGPYVKEWRASYKKNESPKKIAANFAEVDRLIAGLRNGSLSWEQASKIAFMGFGPGPYFVGYEMAKAIDRDRGPSGIASILSQHPANFFRTYIDLYRKNPDAVPAKFSKETEAYILALKL
jgi:hypothetical protein